MYQSVTKLRKVDFVCVGCITPPVCLLWLHVSQLSLSFRSTHYIRHQTSDIREQTLCVCLTLKKNSSKFSFVLRWRHKKNRKTTWLTELRRLKVWLIKLNLFFFILSSPGFPHKTTAKTWTHSPFPAWAPGRWGCCRCWSCWSPSCTTCSHFLLSLWRPSGCSRPTVSLCLQPHRWYDGHAAQPIMTQLTGTHWPMSISEIQDSL